jgi:hypothetical protein
MKNFPSSNFKEPLVNNPANFQKSLKLAKRRHRDLGLLDLGAL